MKCINCNDEKAVKRDPFEEQSNQHKLCCSCFAKAASSKIAEINMEINALRTEACELEQDSFDC